MPGGCLAKKRKINTFGTQKVLVSDQDGVGIADGPNPSADYGFAL